MSKKSQASPATPRKKGRKFENTHITAFGSSPSKSSDGRQITDFFGNTNGVARNKRLKTEDEPELPMPETFGESLTRLVDDQMLADEEFARQLQTLEDNQMAEDEELAKRLGGQVTPRAETPDDVATPRPSTVQEDASSVTIPSSAFSTPQKPKVIGIADEGHSAIYDMQLGSPEFDPTAHADLAKRWTAKSTPYALLAHTFTLVTGTRSRLLIVEYLVNMLRMIILYSPDSLLDAVWLCTNAIAPPYENTELGLGGSIISKAIKNVSGISNAALKTLNDKYGDAGDVAFDAKTKTRTLFAPQPLTIKGVYKALRDISNAKGNGSGEKKQGIVEKLLLSAKGEEVRYVARTLVAHLRIGAVKTTMLIALARAFTLNKAKDSTAHLTDISQFDKNEKTDIFKRAEQIVKQSFARKPNYNRLVPALLAGGIESLLSGDEIELGVPIKPMLGLITKDLNDMFTRLAGQRYTCEYKYDGQRAQIHCNEEGEVTIFSRHLEKMTEKYPDLCALIPSIRTSNVASFVMEGEVVAWDKLGGMQNFQSLAARARKNVEVSTVKQQVCLFAFDLMYLNGKSLLGRSLRDRRDLLKTQFTEIPDQFTFVKCIDYPENNEDDVHAFFKAATDAKCEGIMAKLLEDEIFVDTAPTVDGSSKKNGRKKELLATYTPDQRLESWLKVKKDYDAGADSLDLVPIGAWHGMGRKASWWSPILLAVRDNETGMFQAVCKCISGFTDQFYKDLKVKYAEDADTTFTGPCPGNYDSAYHPDVWFHPLEVWEVRGADITLSPVYRAGLGLVSDERGFSIRFPRFMKKREDKSIEESSTGEDVAYMVRKTSTFYLTC
ncbi:DNA ligase [Taphrina deformans PYCC 5710]|uniref:DNA ligase n=1 Tax=Taphrina deformans (strain PYCC 5710 / ATCC 11124 / CBS 356.35 / IMI 108563 / JCM 9778 / NBRC 8474) TaxID=1097556 RepID=R4XDW7_TAPDE|nr:DNA ligase [Taphrina deformans PYCC 5710]|eukprot:CCG82600.1 DNA ligase [Taphrina deformans PYCC 5710]